jgi:hypothetical protein
VRAALAEAGDPTVDALAGDAARPAYRPFALLRSDKRHLPAARRARRLGPTPGPPAGRRSRLGRLRESQMHVGGRMVDIGALVFGAILLLVGGYYLLVNTFGIDLPELNWDMIWPILLIALGVGVLAKAVASRSGSDKA